MLTRGNPTTVYDNYLGPLLQGHRDVAIPNLTNSPCVNLSKELSRGASIEHTVYTYSLHCSSFFWFNQIYNKDPIR